MSVKRNSFANVIGVGYSSAVALLIIPRYLVYLDAEAFGLIGFFVLAQAWLALLDMGFSQAIARSAAIQGRDAPAEFRRLLASVEWVFVALAIAVIIGGMLAAPVVMESWLNVASLQPDAVVRSLQFMAIAIGLRLWAALYKSCLQGLELQVRLNALNVFVATLRYPGSLLLLHSTGMDYAAFFLYQVAVVVLELLLALGLVYAALPASQRWRLAFQAASLRGMLPFAMSVAYASTVSALVVQVDRMVFSGVLPLAQFGYLTTVTLISTGIVQLGGPVLQALLPRLTALYASGDRADFERMYLAGAEALALLLAPLSLTIALFGEPVLAVWTDNAEAAAWGARPLFWYALGSLFLTYATGAYLLQYVRGNLSLHTRYVSAVLVLQTPVLVLLAIQGGVVPVALAWCLFRAGDVLVWGAFVHRRLSPGLFGPWLRCIFRPVASSLLVLVPAAMLMAHRMPHGAAERLAVLISITLLTVAVAVLLSPLGRRQLIAMRSRRA
jgi:O-antigen/teichoic acid export membrane protein